jgi:hypothetical protein
MATETLPSAKFFCQELLCWRKMDMDNPFPDHRLMPVKSNRARPKRPPPPKMPLYVGQWLSALGIRPREVVKATGINEGYLSEIISGKKTGVGTAKVAQIAAVLGIPWQYLYRPPPDRKVIDEAISLDPAVLARLRETTRH